MDWCETRQRVGARGEEHIGDGVRVVRCGSADHDFNGHDTTISQVPSTATMMDSGRPSRQ